MYANNIIFQLLPGVTATIMILPAPALAWRKGLKVLWTTLNVLKKNLILLTVLITISFTVFGTPIILLLDLIKGFTLGYTFSFFNFNI